MAAMNVGEVLEARSDVDSEEESEFSSEGSYVESSQERSEDDSDKTWKEVKKIIVIFIICS